LEGKVVEEIRDFLQWGSGTLGGDHKVGCCGFGGHSFDSPVAAFF
jgi:Fe-S oxidoreductase